jgi:hypothetical protein
MSHFPSLSPRINNHALIENLDSSFRISGAFQEIAHERFTCNLSEKGRLYIHLNHLSGGFAMDNIPRTPNSIQILIIISAAVSNRVMIGAASVHM